jgi:hypothetical protein
MTSLRIAHTVYFSRRLKLIRRLLPCCQDQLRGNVPYVHISIVNWELLFGFLLIYLRLYLHFIV